MCRAKYGYPLFASHSAAGSGIRCTILRRRVAAGTASRLSLLLPGAHAVGHTFVEVSRTDDSLYAPEPHPLSYLVAHAGEGEGDTLALQLLDGAQQRVAGAGVDEVHRICVQKHMLRRRTGRGQRSLQPLVEMTDTREEQVAAGAPDQQPGEGDAPRGGAGRRDTPPCPAAGRARHLAGGWFDRSTSAATAPHRGQCPAGRPSVSSPATTIAASANSQRLRASRSRR